MRSLLVAAFLPSLFLACAGNEPSDETRGAEALTSSTELFACTDKADPTTKAALSIDAYFHLTWTLAAEHNKASLLGVTKQAQDGITSYTLQTASGAYISLDQAADGTMTASRSGYEVDCGKSVSMNDAALAHLIEKTARTMQAQRPFAVCSFDMGDQQSETDTITIRPSLGGTDVVIEGSEGDTSFALLTHDVPATGTETVYAGEGGTTVYAAGQHTASFTRLTVNNSSPASLSWNAAESLPANKCQLAGTR
jgi:hypothetical protein